MTTKNGWEAWICLALWDARRIATIAGAARMRAAAIGGTRAAPLAATPDD